LKIQSCTQTVGGAGNAQNGNQLLLPHCTSVWMPQFIAAFTAATGAQFSVNMSLPA
jgi:hypothetical protein